MGVGILDMNFATIKELIGPYWKSLGAFQFNYYNPLFWAMLVLVFFVAVNFWGTKKALSFCIISAVLLLLTTQIEKFFVNLVSKTGEVFDPIILRAISFLIILVIGLYYSWVRED